MSRAVCILALALLGIPSASAFAQTGSIAGVVVDESGGRVPGATVVLAGSEVRRLAVTEGDGSYRFERLPSGDYELHVQLSGFTSERPAPIHVDHVRVVAPDILLAIARLKDVVVVTASRKESNIVDAPATMTVLPAAVLPDAPANNVGDLLRAVPGLNVIQMSARDVNLTSRQATRTLATSQLALLDGRSIYLDFFGLIFWDFVPTNVQDIDRIEVVRGPASAVWGANALTGVVNVITKSPRETPSRTTVTLNGGWFDRAAGSTGNQGQGMLYGANVTTSQVLNDRWAYRLSAGYFNSDPLPRPVGRIPRINDPRRPGETIGGAFYPLDNTGAFGVAFPNKGTSQPKFDMRLDQELTRGRIVYAGGVAGSEGIVHTGAGPFDIQPGSTMTYGHMRYQSGALEIGAFANLFNANAPNLLVPDARTGGPLRMDFSTQTYDVEARHATAVGARHVLSYGGNYRRNNFDITLAPASKGRNELGAYIQDEIFMNRWRFVLGGRVDKFGNIGGPVFSPRLAGIFRVTEGQSMRLSFNRAFRSPSTINNYLDMAIVTPVDLSALGVQDPFPLVVHGVGSELAIGSTPQQPLREESVTAYEVAYTGSITDRTTVGAAFYVNNLYDSIEFVTLPSNRDPYTPVNPPPGWPLPPGVIGILAQAGVYLPRTAFTYLNLGRTRDKGLELSVDHRISRPFSIFANYSWQAAPEIVDESDPFLPTEIGLPPTHRFNIGGTFNGRRYLGALNVNHTGEAFWSDVLTPEYHGFTSGFTLVVGSAGVKWRNERMTTLVKVNNLLNRTIQQHIFGDLIRRSVSLELRVNF